MWIELPHTSTGRKLLKTVMRERYKDWLFALKNPYHHLLDSSHGAQRA